MTLTFDDTTPNKSIVVVTPEDVSPMEFVFKRFQWGNEVNMLDGIVFLEIKDPIERTRKIVKLTDKGTVGYQQMWAHWYPLEEELRDKVLGIRLGVFFSPYPKPVFVSQRFIVSMTQDKNATTLADMLTSVAQGEPLTEEMLINALKENN